MYPKSYFELFPPFPRENKVFVAMSFEKKFQARWEQVISPAIRNVRKNDIPLEPHRVDARLISDSILTEILGGISNSLIVFADISTMSYLDRKPVRNGNVMYEVGLAQAVRLPEEVLLFRSDPDQILFDIANVRINSYKPDEDPKTARQLIADSIVGALNELDLKRQLAVKAVGSTLDLQCWLMLVTAINNNGIQHFQTSTMKEVLAYSAKNAAITRLLELGALSTKYLELTPNTLEGDLYGPLESLMTYKPTQFGKAIMEYAANEMGLFSQENREALEMFFTKEK